MKRLGKLVTVSAVDGMELMMVCFFNVQAPGKKFTLAGTCKSCKRGLFQMCSKEEINGVTRYGGCMHPHHYF